MLITPCNSNRFLIIIIKLYRNIDLHQMSLSNTNSFCIHWESQASIISLKLKFIIVKLNLALLLHLQNRVLRLSGKI